MSTVTDAPMLLPTPRKILMREGWTDIDPSWAERVRELAAAMPAHETGVQPWPGLALVAGSISDGPEAFFLEVRKATGAEPKVLIIGANVAAWRHGLRTLGQLLKQYRTRLPRLVILDSPSFAKRGVMLDVSRDKVPTMEELRKTIDLLSELKYNHLQLYTEHTFAYAGHEDVWRDWSPITPEEARELDRYAAARGVELAPNQNCFGHLAHWLKMPRYAGLAEIEGDGAWKFLQWERRGPFSLCPTVPESEAFVRDLLGQLLPCFTSELVNVGCDETFDVGWGRSAEKLKARSETLQNGEKSAGELERSRVELYFEFVGKIAGICSEMGRRPMMWADIALSHPELLGQMPRRMLGLAWWYEPTEKFETWVKALREHGHDAWVCPGTSGWRSFTGRTTERRGNIADAAEQGVRAGAEGFLLCDWGDLGHRQQWPISLAGFANGAEGGWHAERARAMDLRAASLHAFNDPSYAIGPWLDELGDVDLNLRQAVKLTNATAIFNDLHPPVPQALKPGQRAIDAPVGAWQEVQERLRAVASRVPRILDPLLGREVAHALAVSGFAIDHAIAVRQDHLPAGERTKLAGRLRDIEREHRELWLSRNRPGGLAHSCSYYQQVIAGLEREGGGA